MAVADSETGAGRSSSASDLVRNCKNVCNSRDNIGYHINQTQTVQLLKALSSELRFTGCFTPKPHQGV